MTREADILVFGTGSFAARIVLDIAATARRPVRVAISGRNLERLNWLRVAANARAAIFGSAASFVGEPADLSGPDAGAEAISAYGPSVVVQAASLQASSVIATKGDAWSRLVAEGGLSATAVFQAVLSARVARAVPPGCHFINCCFPDVVNGIIAAQGLPVTCGTGNVSILSSAFAGSLARPEPGALRVLAHYQCIGAFRMPAASRRGPRPRVWLDGVEVEDVFARFADVKLTPEPAIEISGAAGVPLMLAIASRTPWRGHAPGPLGLPGGYPVAWEGAALALDLPSGLERHAAIAWNARFEAENGLVVGRDGFARYTGVLADKLRAVSPDLAKGFAVADLETVHAEMAALRSKLQARP
jgi:hypothetical protein